MHEKPTNFCLKPLEKSPRERQKAHGKATEEAYDKAAADRLPLLPEG